MHSRTFVSAQLGPLFRASNSSFLLAILLLRDTTLALASLIMLVCLSFHYHFPSYYLTHCDPLRSLCYFSHAHSIQGREQRRYQILLRSTNGAIDVYLVR